MVMGRKEEKRIENACRDSEFKWKYSPQIENISLSEFVSIGAAKKWEFCAKKWEFWPKNQFWHSETTMFFQDFGRREGIETGKYPSLIIMGVARTCLREGQFFFFAVKIQFFVAKGEKIFHAWKICNFDLVDNILSLKFCLPWVRCCLRSLTPNHQNLFCTLLSFFHRFPNVSLSSVRSFSFFDLIEKFYLPKNLIFYLWQNLWRLLIKSLTY